MSLHIQDFFYFSALSTPSFVIFLGRNCDENLLKKKTQLNLKCF